MSEYKSLDDQMHGPEMLYRSQALDEKLAVISSKRHWVQPVTFAFVVVLNLGLIIGLIRVSLDNHKTLMELQQVAQSSHYAITSEIPSLNYQIERQDFQLAHAKLISDEEVAVILRLAHQVIRLGGHPGQIVIK